MTNKQKENGNKVGFGQKSTDFLKKKSRAAVENYSDTAVLYYEVDYENSKKNFYGEMLVKKWKNQRGVKVQGTVSITESTELNLADVPNKLTSMKVSVYTEHLRELGIWPQNGDYFSAKNRMYVIQTKEILDVNEHSILVDKDAYSIVFNCGEADDESTIPQDIDEKGTANDQFGTQQFDKDYNEQLR